MEKFQKAYPGRLVVVTDHSLCRHLSTTSRISHALHCIFCLCVGVYCRLVWVWTAACEACMKCMRPAAFENLEWREGGTDGKFQQE